MKKLFTSEAVTEGHPDKIADQLSDTILEEILKQDKDSRVACEVFITTGLVVVGGEITTAAYVDIQKIVRDKIREIGYTRAKYGFDADTCGVIIAIDEQSRDISEGVDKEDGSIGAGDQGIMFGYACLETKEYMPLASSLAQKLAKRLSKVRKDATLPYILPDGKTQVTVEYEDGKISKIDTIVISTQHKEEISLDVLRKDIKKEVIDEIIPKDLIKEDTKIIINPAGNF